jgi:hypothetical protein
LGARIEETPHIIENLITSGLPMPDITPVSEVHLTAFSHFRERQSLIEAHMWQNFQQSKIPYEQFVDANMRMARNILSALMLGDMNYIGVELKWIKQLLVNHQWPDGTLRRYLTAYHEAVTLYTNGPGRPIVNWLTQILESEE